MHLALYTFGVFSKPFDDPANDSFHALDERIWPILDRAPGLIGRSGYVGDLGPRSWGVHHYPTFYPGPNNVHSPSTLSLWECPEAAMAFSYHGLHGEAFKRGREWFEKPKWPPYAAWWVDAGNRPNWKEAVRRHRHLHEHGPSVEAFSFKSMFDADGNPVSLDTSLMKTYVERALQR